MNWGLQLTGAQNEELHYCILLFADNFWLLAKNPTELESMYRAWLKHLRKSGWCVPSLECKWGSTMRDNVIAAITDDEGTEIRRVGRSEGFKALGCHITLDNRFAKELNIRIDAAWRSFYKHYDTLCNKDLPIQVRLKFLEAVVRPVLFWCCGSWTLTADERSRLTGLQQKMMRKVIRLEPAPWEDKATYFTRLAHAIRNWRQRCQLPAWDVYYLSQVQSWAGHVERMSQWAPRRLTLRTLHLMDYAYLFWLDSQYGQQCHCARVHIWRWEGILVRCHGVRWHERVHNAHRWEEDSRAQAESYNCSQILRLRELV